MLLEAEEYHAGNREVEDPPQPTKKEPSWEAQRAYRRRVERQRLVGKTVRLAHPISTTDGTEYEKGSLWRVAYSEGGGLTIRPLTETGEEKNGKSIRKVEPRDLIEVESGVV